jgi:hypothetical protein
MVSGKSSLNHWTAANVDVDFVVKHIGPLGVGIGEFLTYSFLRPMLEVYEGLSAADARGYRVTVDMSPIMSGSDEAGSATELHRNLLISDESMLRAHGFDPADAPNDDEVYQRRAMTLIMTAPSIFAKALLPTIAGFENIDPEALTVGGAAAGGMGGGNGLGEDPATKIDAGRADVPQSPIPGTPGAVPAVVLGAADMAVERALERAENRVRSRARHLPDLAPRVAATAPGELFAWIDPETLQRCGLTADDLFAGAWTPLASRVRHWVEDANRGAGPVAASQAAITAVDALTAALDRWVTENLHTGLPRTPAGTRVPPEVVERALWPTMHR